MGKTTGIAYARSTRNIWAGCTKIGPGCEGCFAEAFNRWTQGKDPETGEARNWGPGRQRTPYLEGAWRDLRAWNQKAKAEASQPVNAWHAHLPPGFWPVFVNTMSDFFDNEVPQAWRDAAFPVFEECANLTILLVTKRIGNAAGMVPERWILEGFPLNVRVIATIVNQAEAERDLHKLLALPCKNGVSYEPALDAVDWLPWLRVDPEGGSRAARCRIEWLLPGGESDQAGHKARPANISWARSTVAQCKAAGVPVFVKQLGSNAIVTWTDDDRSPPYWVRLGFIHPAGEDPAEWPADLRVREWAL